MKICFLTRSFSFSRHVVKHLIEQLEIELFYCCGVSHQFLTESKFQKNHCVMSEKY